MSRQLLANRTQTISHAMRFVLVTLFLPLLLECLAEIVLICQYLCFLLKQDREKLSDEEMIKLLSNYSAT